MTVQQPYGCHNRQSKDGYWVNGGTNVTDNNTRRTQWPVWIKDRGTPDCQYRKATPDDPRCVGCRVI